LAGQRLHCRLLLGWSNFFLSLAGEAVVQFTDALDGSLKHSLVPVEIQARLGLGAVFRQLGRFDTALDHLSQAWHLAEATDDDVGQMRANITIGEIHLALGRPEEALDCFFRARTLIQGSQRRTELIDILLSLGQTFQTLKRTDEALEQLTKALALSKEVGNRIAEARSLNLLGLLHRDWGEWETSEEYHLECLRICQEINHPWGQLDAYYNLGDLQALRGSRDEALRFFEKVSALAVTLDAQSHRVRADLRISELWEQAGNPALALEAMRRALVLERTLKAEEASRNVRTLLDEFQAEQSRNQAELLRLRSEKFEAESKELKKALDSLRVISELGRRITSSLTVSGFFQTLYESLSQIFDLPGFGLALYDPKDNTMRYPFRIRNGHRVEPRGRKPMENTLSGWALEHHSTLLVSDIEKEAGNLLDEASAAATLVNPTFHSAVFLPLFAGDERIGVVTIQHPRVGAFEELHCRFLETLAGFIVVALRNALSHRKVRRLNRQILRLAQYDPLTGLANRRLLTDYLKRTIALSQRRHRRFALYFLDLDGFKPVNDQWGHEAGDWVLAQLGERLKASLRDSDLVARVGGDEFVALALEVDQRPSIEAIAEKLFTSITDLLLWHDHEIRLGVSIGIAVYPETATDAEGLMNRADNAMYQVKHGGKNTWAFAEPSLSDDRQKWPDLLDFG